MKDTTGETVYTIGHSNRDLDVLLRLLEENGIATLVDVRRAPWSRRHPQFCRPALERAFESHPITYVHLEALGGHRPASGDSPNGALPEGLRGYADYTSTRAFRSALERALTFSVPVCFMCAEALPSNCHRSILSDELIRRGIRVVHIIGESSRTVHILDPRAVDGDSGLIYPSTSTTQLALPLD